MLLRKIFFYPALFILCWVYAIKFNDIDYDLWARMAVGKIFFQTGQVLPYDIFSYTLTKEWIDHEWGSGVIFYFFADKFHDMGLLALKIILVFTILFLITRIVKLQNPKPHAHKNILFYILIILSAFFGIFHTIRCQLFTFTLFTLWIYVLERVRRGETRLLWILPVTMLIWANLHGGFVAGIGLLGMYGVGEFLNRKPCAKYFLALIPTSLVTLINPYGFDYLKYIFHATTMDRSGIGEWQMTNLFTGTNVWYSLKIIIIITVISLGYHYLKNRPGFYEIDKVRLIVLGITLYLAISHIKHQTFFVVSAASFIYHDFYAMFKDAGNYLISKNREIMPKIMHSLDLVKSGLIYLLLIGGGMLFILYTPAQVIIPIDKFPLGSVEFVRQNNLKGNLLTVFHWGSYAAWKLYPNCLIALDGRYEEVYPNKTFIEVSNFISFQNIPDLNIYWDSILKNYHTDIIILSTQSEHSKKAYRVMKHRKGWQMVYKDIISAVFVREKDLKEDYIQMDIHPLEVFREKYKTEVNFNGKS